MASVWLPPGFSPKQKALYQCSKRLQLATGPRFAGKTWAMEHAVLRHGWNNQGRIGIVSLTSRAGLTGVWPELTTTIFGQWVEAGIASKEAEFGWVRPPWIHAVTKIPMAIMRNKFGGETELQLFPIERPEEAGPKLFSTQWSCLWLSEAHLYPTDERGGCSLFTQAHMQLRLLSSVPFENHRLFCDANPPEDGKENWLYKTFYELPCLRVEDFPDFWDEETRKGMIQMRDHLAVFEFELDDNHHIGEGQKASIRAAYSHDRDLYRRFVLGEWIDVKSPETVFRSVWDKNIHVVGNADSPDESQWELLAPSKDPSVLYSRGVPELGGGWDPGEVNHAWVAVQPRFNSAGQMCFDVLEELFVRPGDEKDEHSAMPIVELTRRILDLRKAVSEFGGFEVVWQDFSDSSALKYRTHATKEDWIAMPAEDELVDAALIEDASNSEITLIGSGQLKKPGWQRRRVNFIAQLLKDRRIRVSAHCKKTISMFENLRKSTDPKCKTYLDPVQIHKHLFDALSYVVCMYLLDEITFGSGPQGGILKRRVLV